MYTLKIIGTLKNIIKILIQNRETKLFKKRRLRNLTIIMSKKFGDLSGIDAFN